MAVAYGKSAKEAGLDGQIIRAEKLEKIAGRSSKSTLIGPTRRHGDASSHPSSQFFLALPAHFAAGCHVAQLSVKTLTQPRAIA
jgi:hypothetical protein